MNNNLTPLIVLNELSIPKPEDEVEPSQLRDLLSEIVEVLKKIVAIRSDISLYSPVPLSSTSVGKNGLTYSALADSSGGVTKEKWRYLQRKRDRADRGSTVDLAFQHVYEGEECKGLGMAALLKVPALSFQHDSKWSQAEVDVHEYQLVESGTEVTADVVTKTVSVKNVAHCTHVLSHKRYVQNLGLPEERLNEWMWTTREARFPHVFLLPRVEKQLTSLDKTAMTQVNVRLLELEDAVSDWQPSVTRSPEWRSKVTPESATRQDRCYFSDQDGKEYLFEMHARYTPGPGRIHFRVVAGPGRPEIRVAYIGEKL